jgi:hypothetical protein
MTERPDRIDGRPVPPVLLELRTRLDRIAEQVTDLNSVTSERAAELVRQMRFVRRDVAHLDDLVKLIAEARGVGHRELAAYLGLRGWRGMQNERNRANRHWPAGVEQAFHAQPKPDPIQRKEQEK